DRVPGEGRTSNQIPGVSIARRDAGQTHARFCQIRSLIQRIVTMVYRACGAPGRPWPAGTLSVKPSQVREYMVRKGRSSVTARIAVCQVPIRRARGPWFPGYGDELRCAA